MNVKSPNTPEWKAFTRMRLKEIRARKYPKQIRVKKKRVMSESQKEFMRQNAHKQWHSPETRPKMIAATSHYRNNYPINFKV